MTLTNEKMNEVINSIRTDLQDLSEPRDFFYQVSDAFQSLTPEAKYQLLNRWKQNMNYILGNQDIKPYDPSTHISERIR
jgi:hypothetical protein